MAKVVVEFDTKDKSMAVSIDGKAVPDVVDASFSRGSESDGFSCGITTATVMKDVGIQSWTRLAAAASAEGIANKGAPMSKAYAGFVVLPGLSRTQSDIQNFFSRK